ncbi:Tyrosine-protein phosphatase non-receptor type [Fasciola gigantica]|uniref:protein-tyrosine-phosphatase n=1 Tax=Fasciola gigantica TaxID=46835 RepID=A0A504YX71_FASGI|nr:Tyrosine-protein phosphatase non-receptor type [Fasciola gigantica]
MVTYIGPEKENQLTKEQLIEGDPYDLKTLLSLYESHKLWNIVYERLKNRSTVFNCEVTYEAARDVHNRWKNRYRDIIPYDSTRVILDSGCVGNYINASYVEVPIAPSRRYILTQGPMQQTSSHFWLMVWERRSPAIVMLNRIFEKGLMKCHPYFPQKCLHPVLYFDDVDLRIKLNVEATHKYFVKRILCISNTRTNEQHEVVHLHYTNWPDFGVPFSPSGLLDFLWIVRNSGALDNPKHPPVIHCSAGVGRSGAFVLIDLALHLVEVLGNIRGPDLAELFVELRRCRMGVIQTAEQLRFCYCAIVQGTEAILSVPPEEISSIRFSPNSREVSSSDASADEGWDGMMEEEDDSSSEDLEKIENNGEGLLGPSGLTTDTEIRLLSRYNAFEQMSPLHVPDDATESDSDFSSSVLRIRNSPWISSSYPSNTSDEVIQQYMISAAIATESSPHLISSTFSGADGKFHHCSDPVDEDFLDTTHLDRRCTLAVMKEDRLVVDTTGEFLP